MDTRRQPRHAPAWHTGRMKRGKNTTRSRTPKKRDEKIAAMNRRFLERIRNAPDRGTCGQICWSREELHKR